MSVVFRTLIVPADIAPLARNIAAALDAAGAGMWETALAPTVTGPATHYVSTGWIAPGWQAMVPCDTWEQETDGAWVLVDRQPGDPLLVYHAATEAGLAVTLDEIVGLFAVADVTEQPPFVAFDRLGLVMVQTEDIPA